MTPTSSSPEQSTGSSQNPAAVRPTKNACRTMSGRYASARRRISLRRARSRARGALGSSAEIGGTSASGPRTTIKPRCGCSRSCARRRRALTPAARACSEVKIRPREGGRGAGRRDMMQSCTRVHTSSRGAATNGGRLARSRRCGRRVATRESALAPVPDRRCRFAAGAKLAPCAATRVRFRHQVPPPAGASSQSWRLPPLLVCDSDIRRHLERTLPDPPALRAARAPRRTHLRRHEWAGRTPARSPHPPHASPTRDRRS